jgi:DNA-binding PadR family transcriptional regulator
MEELTRTELVVLAAIADQARYGYELVDRIDELTSGQVRLRPGNLYRVIDRLLAHGLAAEVSPPPDVDGRRRYFKDTALGRRTAAAQLSMYSAVLLRIPRLRDAHANG